MIDRYNVLDLFGADKNKYHSCIITCFSFDFLFFEQRVLPRLRRAGMLNINVFVDARMYQQQLSNVEGQYLTSQSYSIIPIHMNGAFHPKILMGIGKNNGFLAIGSGNLTNSGLSSNDEVWGAFHTYRTEGNATPIFKTAYAYLNKLQAYCYGSNKDKWLWLEKNATWLTELNSTTIGKEVINKKEKSILIPTFNDASIYKELLNNLPKEPVENITIISPFYNKSGIIISELLNNLNPKRVDVVVDSRFGTVPHEMPKFNNVYFHDWQHVKTDDRESSPRLHAKIIQFTFKNKTCLLTGSANATKEALGLNLSKSKNAEMSLFLKTDESKNWLEELQISIPKENSFDLGAFKPLNSKSTEISHKSYDCKIKHAEFDSGSLYLHIDNLEKLPSNCTVVIERKDSSKSLFVITDSSQDLIVIAVKEEDVIHGFKVYVDSSDGIRVSEYAKIHNKQLIQRTNPDVKSTRFFEIISGSEIGESDLRTLLEFAHFNDSVKINNASGNSSVVKTDIVDDDREYDKISEEEFNQNESSIQDRTGNSSSNISMLEDFLHSMVFGDKRKEDLSDSPERAKENADTGINEDENADPKPEPIKNLKLSFTEGIKTRNAIQSTLKRIHSATSDKHKIILENLIDKTTTELKASIEDIEAVLVGSHLIFMKLNESFDEERIKLTVRYKSLESLGEFEKIRGARLERLESQKGSKFEEVTYSLDANAIEDVKNNANKIEGISIVYQDETPSIIISHSYFKGNPIFSKNKVNVISVTGFLVNVVSPLLLNLANGIEGYNQQEMMRFENLRKRLFYRVVLLFLISKWKTKDADTTELLLLNIFYQLLPHGLSVAEILEELKIYKSKFIKSESDYSKNEEYFIRVLNSYLSWDEIYKLDKSKLINELGKHSVGELIFKSKFGFSRILGQFNGSLNLETSLGFFNEGGCKYEINNVIGGLKGIMYKN